MNRNEIGNYIVDSLSKVATLKKQEFTLQNRINTFVIDDVLPENIALEIYNNFPSNQAMLALLGLRGLMYNEAQR